MGEFSVQHPLELQEKRVRKNEGGLQLGGAVPSFEDPRTHDLNCFLSPQNPPGPVPPLLHLERGEPRLGGGQDSEPPLFLRRGRFPSLPGPRPLGAGGAPVEGRGALLTASK